MWWVILTLHPGQCPSANEDCSLTSNDSTTYFLESFGVTVGIILRHKKQTGLGNIELFCSDGRRDERYTYEGIHRRNYQRINIYLSIAVKIPTFFITCGMRKIFCQIFSLLWKSKTKLIIICLYDWKNAFRTVVWTVDCWLRVLAGGVRAQACTRQQSVQAVEECSRCYLSC